MAATADLPPGARGRMWLLVALTFAVGVTAYALFGRTIILVAGAIAVVILLYLLLGVELQLRKERRELGPIVTRVVAALEPNGLWILLAANGTVLALTDAGARELGHTPNILVGQQLADLAPRASEKRAELAEALRFASLGQPWSGELDLADESGARRELALRSLVIEDAAARRQGMVALGSAA